MTRYSPIATLCCLLPALASGAPADEAPVVPVQKIDIVGKAPNEQETRRQSTAPTQIYGREELDRHGDGSVLEVLKRLPGITSSGRPRRGSGIQMRGMGNGYTQILVNGEPAPRGMALDAIPPEQVDRIELTRSATAEHSARAVAGTINIVLREDVRKLQSEARLGAEWSAGRMQPSLMLQHTDRIDNFSYNLSANLAERDTISRETTQIQRFDPATQLLNHAHQESDEAQARGHRASLTGRMNWRLDGGATFSLQPFLMSGRTRETLEAQSTQSLGSVPPNWNSADTRSDSLWQVARISSNWQGRVGEGRLDLRLSAGGYTSDNDSRRRERDASAALIRTLDTTSDVSDSSANFTGKYQRSLGEGHSFSGGWEIERGRRTEEATTAENRVLQALGGDNFRVLTQRLAVYAQDDWELTPSWSAYAGLRGEQITSEVSSLGIADTHRSQVISPMLHSLWRLDSEQREQIRVSLARTYRPPNSSNLLARPRLNSRFPISGANDPSNADSIGNPSLRPELAWGLDTAYEYFPENGGLFSANLFVRSIDDLVRNVTTLETVSWSPVPRWVTRPVNLSKALSSGIELELKGRLDRWLSAAPAIDLRINFSRFWSSVDDVPGPDNRLDQQPTMTGNLSADYRLPKLPVSVGASINWTPGYDLRRDLPEFYTQGRKNVVDAYLLWAIDPATRLRLSAGNLLHEDYLTSTRQRYTTLDQLSSVSARTDIVWSARLELKL